MQRHYSLSDRICMVLDDALRAVCDMPRTTGREYPAAACMETATEPGMKKHAAGCMRVNHAGEVAAQGLYHGQALASRSPEIQEKLSRAAIEEGDHLLWCSRRLLELGSHRSFLTPFWYAGSFVIGLSAGMAGDRWSLGFLAETETQVMQHLQRHLESLPDDRKTRTVLEVMQQDEAHHRDEALHAGAEELPWVIKKVMRFFSAVMVKTAYRI